MLSGSVYTKLYTDICLPFIVVKAAALLSEKIDELTAQLQASTDEVLTLKETVNKQLKDHTAAVELQKKKSKEDIAKTEEKMSALQNATAASIAKVEKEAANKLDSGNSEAKEKIEQLVAEMAHKDDEYENKILTIEADAEERIKVTKRKSDETLEAIMAKVEKDRLELEANTKKQIADVKSEASKKVKELQEELSHTTDEYEQKELELKTTHEAEIAEHRENMELKVKSMRGELDRNIAKAESKTKEEISKAKELEIKLQDMLANEKNAQQSLKSDLELNKKESFKLEEEVSYWKELHASAGYCNVTLFKEDSQQFINNVMDSTTQGLDKGHKALAGGLSTQVELVQSKASDGLVYFQNELLPSIRRAVGEATDKASDLYDQHVADIVNTKILPLYNEHVFPVYNEKVLPVYNEKVLPVYMEHVSPVVETIKTEAAVALQKSQEGVQVARSNAALAVKEGAKSSIDILQENRMDEKLPTWLASFLDDASANGEKVVDILIMVAAFFLVIMCRSLIFRTIGAVFSIVWFFCPLRLFFGGNKATKKKNSPVPQSVNTNGKATNGKTNGKSKVKTY